MSVLIFDGDDTLWDVEYLYSQAYSDFFSFLYRVLGRHVPNIHFVYQVFFQKEEENKRTWGIRRGRVAQSMKETYQDICAWVEKFTAVSLFDPAHVAEIERIGDQPFQIQKHNWIPGAQEVLRVLKSQGHTVGLLTKYDKTVWPEKAEFLRTSRFFDDSHIKLVDHKKTPNDFDKLVAQLGKQNNPAITVGNGEGDMIALELGEHWRGFYIPIASSSPTERDTRPQGFDLRPRPFEHPRVITLDSIRKILHHQQHIL